jgi:hypothetical protein
MERKIFFVFPESNGFIEGVADENLVSLRRRNSDCGGV